MQEENDSHYLKSVTTLGDTHRIVTSQDIYSKTGIKLAGKGSSINSSIYDRLVKHKLIPALDQCMTVENAVTAEEILARTKQVLEGESHFSRIEELADMDRIWSAISKVKLNDALAFKLTVAREKRPELLEHSLRILLLALYLGVRLDLLESHLVALATASLFHDLGELHIDPEILVKTHAFTEEERRHIYAHPMTAFMILKEFQEYHPLVSTAVLEHHENLDGSGYPAGLSGEKITPLAQILSIAEVTGGILDRYRLEIVLKLNKHKLNTDLIGYLAELFRSKYGTIRSDLSIGEINEHLAHMARAFENWDDIYGRQKNQDIPILRFTNLRISELRQSLFDAGFNPSEMSRLTLGIEDDPDEIQDVQSLINESRWQITSLAKELNRLWPGFEKGEEASIVKDWISNCIECMEN